MIRIQKGTKDVLPFEVYKWHYVEEKVRELTSVFGIREIRTPTFEATELFARGVGDTTDIVSKEMYTFEDRGGRSITLKPEGTAGVARSFIENSLGNFPLPLKMYYLTPVFRYERPQAGRLREHHQFGVEYYGSAEPISDAEVICVAKSLFDSLGITKLRLEINNIGCPECRKSYNKVLREYLELHRDCLCPLCHERMEKNPLRVLDCKEERCNSITKNAPRTLSYLCENCSAHFSEVQAHLTAAGISFEVNPNIVRGLDYYTGTVFEFVSTDIGTQGTVCGGGRYDKMIEELGGKSTPVIGFGLGLERLLLVMENTGNIIPQPPAPKLYIASMDTEKECFKLVSTLRKEGISCETDFMKRSLKAQMKYADKAGYPYVAVIGKSELDSGKVMIKDMQNKENSKEIKISDFFDFFKGN